MLECRSGSGEGKKEVKGMGMGWRRISPLLSSAASAYWRSAGLVTRDATRTQLAKPARPQPGPRPPGPPPPRINMSPAGGRGRVGRRGGLSASALLPACSTCFGWAPRSAGPWRPRRPRRPSLGDTTDNSGSKPRGRERPEGVPVRTGTVGLSALVAAALTAAPAA